MHRGEFWRTAWIISGSCAGFDTGFLLYIILGGQDKTTQQAYIGRIFVYKRGGGVSGGTKGSRGGGVAHIHGGSEKTCVEKSMMFEQNVMDFFLCQRHT